MDAISEKKKMGRRGFGPNSTYSFAVKSPAGGWGTREGRGLCQYFFLVQTPFPPPPTFSPMTSVLEPTTPYWLAKSAFIILNVNVL